MTAAEIAMKLGGARKSGRWWSCRCPAHDDRTPSLSLCDGERSLIVRCFAGCEPREVMRALRRLGLIGGGDARSVAHMTVRQKAGDNNAAARIKAARCIWSAARETCGTPVERYVASRGITMAPPSSLRYAPALRRRDGTFGPAMVARIDDVDGELVAVHRTWIDCDSSGQWRRLDRAMLGRAAGGAVRLAAAGERLMVGEGVETVLSAITATKCPGWAALSTAGLAALVLPPLPLAATLVILADNDENGAGERAARTAARRWVGEGRRVKIALPPIGRDFNDVLQGHSYGELRDVTA